MNNKPGFIVVGNWTTLDNWQAFIPAFSYSR